MRDIGDADLDVLSCKVRMTLYHIVKHYQACQLKQGKPRQFLFSVKDPIIGEVCRHKQIDIVSLCQGNALHVVDPGTGFQSGRFVNTIGLNSAWKLLCKIRIDVYAGAPDYITTGAKANFIS